MKKAHILQYDLFTDKLLNGVTTLEEIILADKRDRENLMQKRYSNNQKLTVLSFGGGQDSTALLYLYVNDRAFRSTYAPNDFMVVMSDTGNEHEYTYEHIEYIKTYCEKHNIEFYFITKDMGFHGRTWQSLKEQYRATNTCGSNRFRKNCTVNLKINVIYKFLEDYIHTRYKLKTIGEKAAYWEFVESFGKISVLIGIAQKEEKRISDNKDLPAWMISTVEKQYPLVDLKMDRKDCQQYILSVGEKVPMPSNCKICPYMNLVELLWLFRNYPDDYWEWTEFEANKIKKFKDSPVNLGVFGEKLLPEALKEAEALYGHMTMEQLNEYKMSHGHCVQSQY